MVSQGTCRQGPVLAEKSGRLPWAAAGQGGVGESGMCLCAGCHPHPSQRAQSKSLTHRCCVGINVCPVAHIHQLHFRDGHQLFGEEAQLIRGSAQQAAELDSEPGLSDFKLARFPSKLLLPFSTTGRQAWMGEHSLLPGPGASVRSWGTVGSR